jgi:hypothetical protein
MKQDGLYTVDQVINKEMGFNMTMSRYICKDGSEAVMHNNKTHVKTADGREWTKASTIVTVANAGIPAATVAAPVPVPVPVPVPIPSPAKVVVAPLTPAKK